MPDIVRGQNFLCFAYNCSCFAGFTSAFVLLTVVYIVFQMRDWISMNNSKVIGLWDAASNTIV